MEASRAAFQKLRVVINATLPADKQMSIDEVAYGFVKVANETMARPIRSLTDARGYASAKHALACEFSFLRLPATELTRCNFTAFGGAGGQHACEIARSLGISTIIIHRYSSILSAYGLALADRAHEVQEPCAEVYSSSTRPMFVDRIEKLKEKVIAELKSQGFAEDKIQTECYLNMRYEGSDTSEYGLHTAARSGADSS